MSESDDLIQLIQSGGMSSEKLTDLQDMAKSQLAAYSNALSLLETTPEASFGFELYRQVLEVGSGGTGTTGISQREWDQMLPDARLRLRSMLIGTVREGRANFQRIKAALDAAQGRTSGSFVPATAAEPLSEPARIITTFVAPTKTFADLKRVSRWWSPFILLTIASYALIMVAGQKVGWEQLAENQMKLQPKQAARIESLPADQRPAAIERAVKFTRGFAYAFPVAFQLPFLLIVAGILMASFNFGAGAEIPFRTSLAVVTYASLPGLLKAGLAIVSLLAGANPENFNFQNPVATNPGYFLDPVASPALFRLASALDVIMIWTLVLAAIGFAAVSKLKRGTTFVVVFGWYVAFILGAAALGGLFS